ncbi:uncharacterized protein C8orf74 homolog [Aplysia californica]|uniref:Uncharacterized protein C8orf74 homolog n=1 Tax=Aplysia californica TaxID=6500 RepID=A0ABM0K2B1_APLCA|nr:uncharacterized protein C8orf74 homolog [Aplysia californica]
MAANQNFEGCTMLSVVEVQQIVKLPPIPAKELVAEKLGIPPYNDVKDPQKAPFINFIYDNIIFAVEKGFPWDHVSLVVKFAHEFLKSILVENHKLPDVIKDFQRKADILTALCDRHKKQYTDFVYDTVLCHYNLYKYVFSHLREIVKPKVEKEVLVPPIPPPLSQGQSVEVWEYQQKVKDVEVRETEAKEKLKQTEESQKEKLTPHKNIEDVKDVPVPYSKMSLEELVKDVLKGYVETKQMELKGKADEMVQDLAFKLDKTALARPAVMGSPPRFKPKSPVPSKASSNNNSLKADKDKSSAKSSRSKSGRASAASSKSKR